MRLRCGLILAPLSSDAYRIILLIAGNSLEPFYNPNGDEQGKDWTISSENSKKLIEL